MFLFLKTVLFVLILLTFGACSVSTLTLSADKNVHVTYDDRSIEIKGERVKKSYINFFPLQIHQEVLRNETGTLLVFERTELDLMYVYSNATAHTMKLIFDAQKINTVYSFNNLHFLQVTMNNAKTYNILVQQSGDQELSFVYGFDHAQFDMLLKQVKKSDDELISPLQPDVSLFESAERAILSRWSAETIYLAPLISPFGYGMPE